ncbi:MAG: prephenate dehydrogenase [Armatimonadetes bacterium]|nr:prephenate dehydrogenase [Armatimonadota bacterium]
MRSDLSGLRVTIVGLGLIGGSLGLAFRKTGIRRITGVGRREESWKRAVSLQACHVGTTSLEEGVRGANLVILCAPARQILALLSAISPFLEKGAVVTDVGSTKEAIVSALNELPPTVQVMGGHPMAGKELGGLENAEAGLFTGRPFVLCPLKRTSPGTVALIEEIVRRIGALPVIMDAACHDRAVSRISHIPYVTSLALYNLALSGRLAGDPDFSLASSGFRSATRLARSPEEMSLDILLTNSDNIAAGIRRLEEYLHQFASRIEKGDVSWLKDQILRARTALDGEAED